MQININDIYECKSCEGKGHVFDGDSLLFPPLWVMGIFERNNPRGMTRETCGHCGGIGYVKIKESFR